MAKKTAPRKRGEPAQPSLTRHAAPVEAAVQPITAALQREPRIPPDAGRWITAGILVLLALTLYSVREILPPFILAAVVAYVLAPLVNRMRKDGVPRTLAVASVYVIFLAIVGGVLTLATPQVVTQVRELAAESGTLRDALARYAQSLSEITIAGITFDVVSLYQQAQIETGAIVSFVTARTSSFIFGFLSSLGWTLVILLVSLYLLLDAASIREYATQLLPRRYRAEAIGMAGDIDRVLRSYIRSQLLLIVVIGVATYVATSILGLRHALLLSIFAGLMEIVPIAGPILAGVPAVLLALVQTPAPFGLANWTYALVVAGTYGLIQQLENNLIVPHLIGRSVNLHPVVVLFGVLAAASLAGLIGVFLAVPVLASVRICGRYLSRWMGASDT